MVRYSSALCISALFALAPVAVAECPRELLQAAADGYVASQTSGQLQPIFSQAEYVENNRTADITSGILKEALQIDHNRTIVDTTTCASYTELVITDSKRPAVVGTQIRHIPGSNGTSRVAVVDSIVTGKGDWQFNATKSLSYLLQENWEPIPAEKRANRTALRAAADAYLDLWGNPNASVPWGTPCERMEGSAYTGKGQASDSCNVGIPGGDQPPNTNRRYVVDETTGCVSVLCVFQTMGNAPDSHEFRIEGGKLRYVHTMTVMTANRTKID